MSSQAQPRHAQMLTVYTTLSLSPEPRISTIEIIKNNPRQPHPNASFRLSSQTPRARYVESPSQNQSAIACVQTLYIQIPRTKTQNSTPNPRLSYIYIAVFRTEKDRTELCRNMPRHPPPSPHPGHILNLDLPPNKHTIRSSSGPPPRPHRRDMDVIFPNPRRRARSPETHLLFKTSLLFILLAETLVGF